MKKKSWYLLVFLLLSKFASAQWQQVSNYPSNPNQKIIGYSFLSPTEGFLAINDAAADDFIGYTTDGGATFTKRDISIPQITVSGLSLTGVYAVNATNLIAYGSYLFQPIIIRSINKGISWELAYIMGSGQPQPQEITDMQFVTPLIGFAIRERKLLKTTNGGANWTEVGANFTSGTAMKKLSFVNETEGYIAANNFLIKVTGVTPAMSVLTALNGRIIYNTATTGAGKVYAYTDLGIYTSSNGGSSFALRTFAEAPLSGTLWDWHFFNDSTGIAQINNRIFKTSSWGQTWELMKGPQNNLAANVIYDDLYFFDNQTGFQATAGPLTFRTSNQGGLAIPKAAFRVDLSELTTQSLVTLRNISSRTHQFRWLRNGQEFATTYDASYISTRQQKDTIALIAFNGTDSDTSIQFVETRVPFFDCNGNAIIQQDTSTVKLFPVDTLRPYRTHEWQMGNGVTLYDIRPVYRYPAKGTYNIRHIVRDPVSGCSAERTFQVVINRLTNCDGIIRNINPVAEDAFLNNRLRFLNEQFDFTPPVSFQRFMWYFGDGDSVNFAGAPVHSYKNSGEYYVKVQIRFNNNLCFKEFFDTVRVQLPECSGQFRIKNAFPNETYEWEARPTDQPQRKKRMWIFDNKDTVYTPEGFISRSYASGLTGFNYNVACFSNTLYRVHNLDSARRFVRYIMRDTVTGCQSEDSMIVNLTFDGNQLNLYQDASNPYVIKYGTAGNIRCVTREGIQSTGVLWGEWEYPQHGTYAINASTNTYPTGVIEIYRRHIIIDGEFRYFYLTEKNEVNGFVYHDLNGNSIQDANEPLTHQYIRVTGTSGPASSVVNSENGRFRFNSDSNIVAVQLKLPKPYYSVVPASAQLNFTNRRSKTDTVRFGLQRLSIVKDGAVAFTPVSVARAAVRAFYRIPVASVGNDTLLNVRVQLLKDPRITIDSFSAVPSQVAGNLIEWQIDTLFPHIVRNIQLSGVVSPAVTLNDTLQFDLQLNGVAGDADTTDNRFTFKQNISSSFAATETRENRAGVISKSEIDNNAWIYYSIRFQNTRSNFRYNVIVRDTLDSKLDWSSFEMIHSNYPHKLIIDNNRLAWFFKNIFIPDSIRNKAGSNGYILFRIKARNNVAVNDTIRNRASIYFDYDLPLVTNQSRLAIRAAVVTSVSSRQPLPGQMILAPNPAHQITNVIIKARLNSNSSLILTNINGQQLWKKVIPPNQGAQTVIPVSLETLQAGVYYLTLYSEGKFLTQQFIIQQ